jgi:serine/threonine protein kinase
MCNYRVDTPLVKSLEDLRTLCNHNTIDDDGNLEFSHSTFSFVTKEHTVYCGRSLMRKLTLEVVNESLKPVADKDVYPEAPSHITKVTTTDSGFFIKRPALTFYDELGGSEKIAQSLLQEAEMLERIKRNPHPNLVRYHGCQVYRGRIVGLVLERYHCTLEERMRNGDGDVDLELGFDGLKSGVMHLHSLGLAHNDIKASNIMVGLDNTWILVDMGSCRPFGEDLIMAGNPQWETSSQQHDEDALSELWIWLTDRKPAKVLSEGRS